MTVGECYVPLFQRVSGLSVFGLVNGSRFLSSFAKNLLIFTKDMFLSFLPFFNGSFRVFLSKVLRRNRIFFEGRLHRVRTKSRDRRRNCNGSRHCIGGVNCHARKIKIQVTIRWSISLALRDFHVIDPLFLFNHLTTCRFMRVFRIIRFTNVPTLFRLRNGSTSDDGSRPCRYDNGDRLRVMNRKKSISLYRPRRYKARQSRNARRSRRKARFSRYAQASRLLLNFRFVINGRIFTMNDIIPIYKRFKRITRREKITYQ